MAALDELTTQLQSLAALKAPGVTPTKIKTITQICVDNIQSDKDIVTKILLQYTNSPATHKLGVLYVVDAVIRQWLERAKKAGQAVSKSAARGTYASGVQMIRDALPVVMEDLVRSAPEEQKEKILKLINIWERGQTFPPASLTTMKNLLENNNKNVQNATAAPPKPFGVESAFVPQTNQQGTLQSMTPVQPPQDPTALYAALSMMGQQNPQTNTHSAAPPFPAFLGVPPPPPGFAPPPPPAATASPAGNNDLTNQILQAMSAGLIAPDQAIQVLNAMVAAQNGSGQAHSLQAPAAPQEPVQAQFTAQNGMQQARDNRYRDRSRSPDYNHRQSPSRRSPQNPNRRASPTYGAYDPSASAEADSANRFDRGRGQGKQRGGRNDRSDYRQRSPPRRQQSPPSNAYGNSKYIEWDNTLPPEHIRVLSRTLFVGGASGTEGEIREIFNRFGQVQTCIVNAEKRHAFVKMMTRPHAVAAKQGMDSLQDPIAQSKARQTRWGVGFGPRECSDYQTGISVIPIHKLTDADRKWALTAEHGGTGGRQLEGGMVIEEPDIEIGAGVSSKAISRRVPTDPSRGYPGRGGFANRGGHDSVPKLRKHENRQANDPRHISPRPEPNVAVPPAVPGFGFKLPGF